MRLDRFITQHRALPCRDVLRLLAAKRVSVDGAVVTDSRHAVDRFSRVCLDDEVVHECQAHYYMLHKPVGVVSATSDPEHQTVIDLMQTAQCAEPLHLAGRLDRNTTGLVLLTNDGQWSRRLTEPGAQVPKVYQVETESDLVPEIADIFAKGFHFACEDRHTQPAQLEILSHRQARLTIYEGLYHQVKRMFHRVGNRVVTLHRERVGKITLDSSLAPGGFRPLTRDEIS